MSDADGEALTEVGKSTALVVSGTEILHPLLAAVLPFAVSPRLVALAICGVFACQFRYEATGLRKIARVAVATLVIFLGAFGANKGIREVRDELPPAAGAVVIAQAGATPEPRPTRRRPLDEW